MEGTPAIYLGRIVEKKNFRAFIYGANGQKRLAESWEEFEANMESGLWFASIEDAEKSKPPANDPVEDDKPLAAKAKPKSKPKPKPKAKPEPIVSEDAEDVLPDDGTVFEVTDDFLPKEGD